jgi:hypothetical protein
LKPSREHNERADCFWASLRFCIQIKFWRDILHLSYSNTRWTKSSVLAGQVFDNFNFYLLFI